MMTDGNDNYDECTHTMQRGEVMGSKPSTWGWKSHGCSIRVGDEMGAVNRSRFAQLEEKVFTMS